MTNINETYAQRHYESALDFFEQGKYAKALQQIDTAIHKSPNNPDYYYTKGVFLHRMNDIPKAMEAYENAVRVFPEHIYSHYNLGLIFMKDGKILQAIHQWEEVIKAKPDDVESIFNIAVALSQLGKTEQAIPFYKKVLEYEPNHVMTHQNLGVIFRDEHNYTQAKVHFNLLKELDSTYSEVVDKEIFRCEKQEILTKFENDKKVAVSLVETCEDSDLGRALSALITEDYEKALDCANAILEFIKTHAPTDSDDKTALMVKGQALSVLGKYEESYSAFEEALKLDSTDAKIYFQMGIVSLDMCNMSQALTCFTEAQKIDPNMPLIADIIENISGSLGVEGQAK